jgi:hypothetical protein
MYYFSLRLGAAEGKTVGAIAHCDTFASFDTSSERAWLDLPGLAPRRALTILAAGKHQ